MNVNKKSKGFHKNEYFSKWRILVLLAVLAIAGTIAVLALDGYGEGGIIPAENYSYTWVTM